MWKIFTLIVIPLLFIVGGCTTTKRSELDAEMQASISKLEARVDALEDVSHLPHDPNQRIRMPK